MKKYMTPELSELLTLEEVLADSEDDNLGDDFVGGDGFDDESDELIIAD